MGILFDENAFMPLAVYALSSHCMHRAGIVGPALALRTLAMWVSLSGLSGWAFSAMGALCWFRVCYVFVLGLGPGVFGPFGFGQLA